MPFIVIAQDYDNSSELRKIHRPAHLEYLKKLQNEKKLLVAAATLNDDAMMDGSVCIFLVSNEQEVLDLLKDEPYVIGKVWRSTQIIPCIVPPMFIE